MSRIEPGAVEDVLGDAFAKTRDEPVLGQEALRTALLGVAVAKLTSTGWGSSLSSARPTERASDRSGAPAIQCGSERSRSGRTSAATVKTSAPNASTPATMSHSTSDGT